MQNSKVILPHLFPKTSWLKCGLYKQTLSKNILLIENNLKEILLIKRIFSEVMPPGFELTYVDSLNGALQRLHRVRFDVVLVDLALPDSQGIETLLHLQKQCPHIPIVILADTEDEILADQAIRQGAQDYLVKGQINPSWLKHTITSAISRSQCRTQQKQQNQRLEQSNQILQSQIHDYKNEIDHLRKELKLWSAIALVDGLTGIANRYCFEQYLEQTWLQSCQTLKPLSLIMIDLDYFKQFNDSCGHLQGDVCLRQVAQFLYKRLNIRALIARYGGEEFAVVLPETSIRQASRIAINLKGGIRALAIRHPSSEISSWVTASFGVASVIPKPYILPSVLTDKADRALYIAKEKGRNLIICNHLSSPVTQTISPMFSHTSHTRL